MIPHRALPYLLSSALLLPLSLLPMAIVQAESIVGTKESDPVLADLNTPSTDPIGGASYNAPHAPDLADLGAPPGRRSGGASRNGNANTCPMPSQPPLTALVPITQIISSELSETNSVSPREFVFSLTTQDRPTLWFYVPYYLDTTSLTFVLQDEDHHTLYKTRLTSPKHEKGIVQVPLPESSPALQPNNYYQWYLALDCAPNEFVHGVINRVPLEASLKTALNTAATPRDRVVLYANHGLWQEALTLSGELYQAAPNDTTLANDWSSLLESVDLGPLTQQPLIDCCTP